MICLPTRDELNPARRAWFDRIDEDCFDEWINGEVVPRVPARWCELKAAGEVRRALHRATDAAGGVREYWIVDPDARTIEQYLSDDCQPYRLLRKLDEGKLKCETVDGFELDVASVFA